MARVQIGISFEYERSGVLIPIPTGTPISIIDRLSSSPATVFLGETGTTTITSVVSDSGGNIPGWVNQGSYRATAAAQSAASPPFPGATIAFEAVRGDGVENYAPGSVTAAALAPGSLMPVGIILDYAGTTAPLGFLICDGSSHPTTGATAALFAVIGTTYGGGGGAFNIPDCRGRGSVGVGQGVGLTNRILGSIFGEESHTLAASEMPAHAHGVTDPGHAHAVSDPSHSHLFGFNVPVNPNGAGWSIAQGVAGTGFPRVPSNNNFASGSISTTLFSGTGIGIFGAVTGISLQAAGSSGGHNNMAPSFALNKIIKL